MLENSIMALFEFTNVLDKWNKSRCESYEPGFKFCLHLWPAGAS